VLPIETAPGRCTIVVTGDTMTGFGLKLTACAVADARRDNPPR